MKTLRTWLVTIAVLLCGTTVSAYDFEVDGLCFNILSAEEQTVEVTYRTDSYNSYSGDVRIPAVVEYNGKNMKVVQIGTDAFYKSAGLISIDIPEGITTIMGGAFSECTSLTSLVIPNSVTALCGENQHNTFYGCSSLETVTLGENVSFLGQSAFRFCSSLKTINLSDRLDSIGWYAFAYCTKLESINLPKSIRKIAPNTFYGCTNLETIVMEGYTPPIQDSYNSEKLTCTLKVPAGSMSLYQDFWKKFSGSSDGSIEEYKIDIEVNGLFYNVLSYEDKTVEVTYKGESSYPRENPYKGNIVIPNSITYDGEEFNVVKLGKESFYYCPDIVSLSIPASVTLVDQALNGNEKLEELRLEDGDMALTAQFNLSSVKTLYLGRDVESETSTRGDFENLTSLTIGNKVRTIDLDFSSSPLKSVTIPNSVTMIGYEVFKNCTSLESVTIESKNIGIDYRCFSGCSNLTKINLEGAQFIGSYAFAGCTSLTELFLSEKIRTIEDYAFYNCSGLNNFVINGLGVLGTQVFYKCTGKLVINCNIPDETAANNKVTGAFYNSNFTSLELGEKVDTVGRFSFNSCTTLKLVTVLGDSYIGDYAFSGCSGLNDFTLLGESSFGKLAFRSCTGCLKINCDIEAAESAVGVFENSSFTSIVLGENVELIGDHAFDGCSTIVSVSQPVGSVSIADYAFYGCSKLTTLDIPDGIGNVGASAFYNCNKLSAIVLNESVESVGSNAFYNCYKLAHVRSNAQTPISVSNMSGFNSSATLTVPNGSAKAYSDMGGFWGQFASIKEEASVNISEANKWSTCALAFDTELPEGVRAFASTGMDENYVLLEEVTALAANTPYILYAKEGYEGTLAGAVDVANYQETVTDGVLSGAIVEQEVSSGYVLQNQGYGMKFYNMNGQTFTIPAGKCWLSAFDASGASVMMRFVGGANDIEGVFVDHPTMEDDAIYDLEGRRVETPQRGHIYIKGGQKVLKR